MLPYDKDGNSLFRSKLVLIEIDGELHRVFSTMLKSGAADSYKDAITKLFNYWNERIDTDEFSNINFDNRQKLSKRQKQLIPLINKGQSNRQIAESLSLSEQTVKVHMWRLFKKLDVSSRTQLLYVSKLNGWI